MLSFNPDKAPGPDGFNAHFFQVCWGIIKHDVCKAVSNFFRSGKLLKQVNSNFLELIPKVDNPEVFEEFRPISLCNVLVKKISKIFLNRLREVLDELVGPHQSAFIKGGNISENILLAHELVPNFHRDKGTPKFCAKLDIRKVYDSVPWDAVLNTLESLKFPEIWVRWII